MEVFRSKGNGLFMIFSSDKEIDDFINAIDKNMLLKRRRKKQIQMFYLNNQSYI